MKSTYKSTFFGFVATLLIVGATCLSYDNYQKNDLDHEWYQIPSGGPE